MEKADTAALANRIERVRTLFNSDVQDIIDDALALAATDGAGPVQKTDREIIDEVNSIARMMLRYIGIGYEAPEDHLFYAAGDSRSRVAWQSAVEVYEAITSSEVHDALLCLYVAAPPVPEVKAEARVVAVKPLEWRDRHAKPTRPNDLVADSVTGQYVIRPAGSASVRAWFPGIDYNDSILFETVETAKAAAQADHEARIRSALVEAPPAPSQEVSADMLTRLKDAIEGECEGLAIDDRAARIILEYALYAKEPTSCRG